MDPATIVGLVSASLSIATRLGTTTKDVCELFKTYRGVKTSLDLIASRNLSIRAALAQIQEFFSSRRRRLTTEVGEGLESALISCSMVMKAVEQRLSSIRKSRTTGVRYLWEERDLKADEANMNSQIAALHLLIFALQLTSSQRRNQAISSLETQRVVKRAADDALSYADTIRNDDRTWDSRTADSRLEHLDKVFSFDEVIVNSTAYRRAFNTYVSSANRSERRSTEAAPKDDITSSTSIAIPTKDAGTEQSSINENQSARFSAHLLAAIRQRNIPWMESVLDLGADINYATDGETPLLCCIVEDFPEGLRFLLDHGADLSPPSCPSTILLLAAFSKGCVSILEILLEQSAPIDDVVPRSHSSFRLVQSKVPSLARLSIKKEHPGDTLVHIASEVDDTAMMELALNYGANINQRDEEGETALHVAVGWRRLQMVKLLLSKGADHEMIDNYGRRVLHVAVQNGTLETVELLLSTGANINESTKKDWTPLSLATYRKSLPLVDLLLKKGADPNCAGSGIPPLCIAAEHNEASMAEILLANGASVNMKDGGGFTPLHKAAQRNSRQAAEVLLANGADVNATEANEGITPLHVAALRNAFEVATLLIKNGANVDSLDIYQETPLHIAAGYNSQKFVELLLAKGADISAPNLVKGRTALHLAAEKDAYQVVALLIENGAAVDSLDRDRRTPLHLAAFWGNVDTARLLAQHGADIRKKDRDGETPFGVTKWKDSKATKEMVDYLSSLMQTSTQISVQYDAIAGF